MTFNTITKQVSLHKHIVGLQKHLKNKFSDTEMGQWACGHLVAWCLCQDVVTHKHNTRACSRTRSPTRSAPAFSFVSGICILKWKPHEHATISVPIGPQHRKQMPNGNTHAPSPNTGIFETSGFLTQDFN